MKLLYRKIKPLQWFFLLTIVGVGLAISLVFSFHNASALSPSASSPIVLPLEVIGPDNTVVSVDVDVAANDAYQVSQLSLQIHNLSYNGKASVQINNQNWITLTNSSVNVVEPGKRYGGIGGAFSTLKLSVPVSAGAIVAGQNTLRFRFNHTDGDSIGYRVLSLNLLTANGKRLLERVFCVWRASPSG